MFCTSGVACLRMIVPLNLVMVVIKLHSIIRKVRLLSPNAPDSDGCLDQEGNMFGPITIPFGAKMLFQPDLTD